MCAAKTEANMNNKREARVRQRAHEIWERQGRPQGEENEHWAQASNEIDAEEGTRPADAAAATGTTPPIQEMAEKRRQAPKPRPPREKKTKGP
jgi:hypothetical protein